MEEPFKFLIFKIKYSPLSPTRKKYRAPYTFDLLLANPALKIDHRNWESRKKIAVLNVAQPYAHSQVWSALRLRFHHMPSEVARLYLHPNIHPMQ